MFRKFNKAESFNPVPQEEQSRISRLLQRLGKNSVSELTDEEREALESDEQDS